MKQSMAIAFGVMLLAGAILHVLPQIGIVAIQHGLIKAPSNYSVYVSHDTLK